MAGINRNLGETEGTTMNFANTAMAVAWLLVAAPTLAQAAAPGLFDKPVSVRKTPVKVNGAEREIRCTYFADFMIRENMEGPTSQDAALVRGTGQPCNAKKTGGEVALKTADMGFDGRKGPALFFSEMDPQGGVRFLIVNAGTGKVVFKDAAASDGDKLFQSVAMTKEGLRLAYMRAINAPCSIMQNAARCWASLVTNRQVPRDMARQIPSEQICSASYKASRAQPDNPSVLTYATELLVDANGRSRVLKHGPLRCSPLP